MKNYESSSKVFEAYFSQYTAGCFRHGDIVTFNKKEIAKSEHYKNMNPELKSKLDDMIGASENGTPIMVHEVGLNPMFRSDFEPSTLSIGYSQGGGRISDIITINGSLGQFMTVVRDVVNMVNTIPTGARREAKDSLAELDVEKIEKNRTVGHVEPSDFS